MRGAPKVTFVICGDGYRAVVDNLEKCFISLSVADMAKKAIIGKVSRVRTSRRAAITGMSTFFEMEKKRLAVQHNLFYQSDDCERNVRTWKVLVISSRSGTFGRNTAAAATTTTTYISLQPLLHHNQYYNF
ncbi:uncharacterized protein LOC142761722 [Rhipicephalus microplus]|uniref:uncharacterized protein LOC142796287 n=1 Tax=Rhipicephalus microplus TaxID=6941 RepID=UPI003F6B1795